MKVTFRCKRSGNTVSFSNEDDIKAMRTHECYEEVLDAPVPSFLQPAIEVVAPEVKRRGRQKKVV